MALSMLMIIDSTTPPWLRARLLAAGALHSALISVCHLAVQAGELSKAAEGIAAVARQANCKSMPTTL